MKLFDKTVTEKTRSQIAVDTEAVVSSRLATGRVCGPSCQAICQSCGETECRCHCSANCEMAPCALSSAPGKHPIEPLIVPLVYALKQLEVFTPCWSCEGHNDNQGNLWKIPRVWFYSDSQVHVRLLAETVDHLYVKRLLNVRWHVGVSTAEPGSAHTMFHLEPVAGQTEETNLDSFRADVRLLADNIPEMVINAARNLALTHV
jgi:hypothetical protein